MDICYMEQTGNNSETLTAPVMLDDSGYSHGTSCTALSTISEEDLSELEEYSSENEVQKLEYSSGSEGKKSDCFSTDEGISDLSCSPNSLNLDTVKTVHDEDKLETLSVQDEQVTSRKKKSLHTGRQRSMSLSDLGISTRSPWSRSNTDIRPITDSHLRSKLKTAKNVRLPAKDQRILERIMSKHENEEYQNDLRNECKLEWDEERQMEKEALSIAENQRRKNLAEQNAIKQKKLREKQDRVRRSQEDLKRDREAYIEYKKQQWAEMAQRQAEAKQQKLLDKKRRELERKKSQEEALKLQETENAEFRQLVHQKLQHDLKRAKQRKEAKEYEEVMHRRFSSTDKKRRQSRLKAEIDEIEREELEDLKVHLDEKQAYAEQNYSKQWESKEQQIKNAQLERERRLELARRAKMEQEVELALWGQDLIEHRKQVEQRASEMAHLTAEQRALRAREERAAKEREQRRNFERIKADEEEWREETLGNIKVKEFKSDLIKQEKEMTIEQSRAIAKESQKLRDDLKKQYAADSFDKKVRSAELQAKIGAGVHGATKNMSSLHLG